MRIALCSLVLAACVPFHYDPQQAQQARQQQVQRMCGDPNYAYETGYNDGLKRARLDTDWVDVSCSYEMRPHVRSAYQSGYNTGIANAPFAVPRGGTYAVAGERCTFSSDCGEGRTCRANQCMGEGYAGEACWFSSDCLSGSCDLSNKTCK